MGVVLDDTHDYVSSMCFNFKSFVFSKCVFLL